MRKTVLIAPLAQTLGSAQSEYDERFHQPLKPVLDEANRMVAEDQVSGLMGNVGFLECPQARVTAGAFLDYYGQNPNSLYAKSHSKHQRCPPSSWSATSTLSARS